jgi:hypothetical protein
MALLLGWQHVNGGVPAHHLLAREDLPAISNWWGLPTLPALAWFLLGRIERRLAAGEDSRTILVVFILALAYGAFMADSFVSGRPDRSDNLAQLVFMVSLAFPVYYAECVLGFVIGMSFFLGAILPMIAACVFAAIGAVLYLSVRFILLRLAARFR